MPANLTPQYHDAEERFKKAASYAEKVEAMREMLAVIPKHKGTEKLQADLKKRLAKLEDDEAHAVKSGHRGPDVGHVRREGAGQFVLLGPPNAGKSSLLAALTHARPEIGDYPFTTRTPVPGMMEFEDVRVQLVDTPAVAAGHTEPYMANLVHNADGVLLVVDVTDDVEPALRLLAELLERARVWPRSRPLPKDAPPFLLARPVITLGNKVDLDDDGTFAALAQEALGSDLPFHSVSALRGHGLETLRAVLFKELRKIRVYTKEPGHKADRSKPFVLPGGATVHDLAAHVHQDLAARLKYARVWGHALFDGQQVDRHHVLADKDVVELHA